MQIKKNANRPDAGTLNAYTDSSVKGNGTVTFPRVREYAIELKFA